MIDEKAKTLTDTELLMIFCANCRAQNLHALAEIRNAYEKHHAVELPLLSNDNNQMIDETPEGAEQARNNIETEVNALNPNIVKELIEVKTLSKKQELSLEHIRQGCDQCINMSIKHDLGLQDPIEPNLVRQSLEEVHTLLNYFNNLPKTIWDVISGNKRASVGVLGIMYASVQIASFVVEYVK